MKNFKVFTVAMLLGAGAITFTSCGGEEKKDEKKDESHESDSSSEDSKPAADLDINMDEGLGHIQMLVQAMESDAIKIDKSSSDDIQEYFDFEDDYATDRYSNKSTFAGYSVSKSYTFYKDMLNSVSYSSFYDEDKHDKAGDDCDAIQDYLSTVFGKPKSKKYPEWETDKYTISYSTYDDGYSFDIKSVNVDKAALDIQDAMVEGASVNDVTKLVTALNDGSIVIGTSTNDETATFFGMESNDYYMDDKIQYSDHSLSRSLDISNKTLSKVKFYSYNNPSVSEQEDMTNVDAYLVSALGDDFVAVGDQKIWKKDNFTVSFSLYSYGGYDLTVEK